MGAMLSVTLPPGPPCAETSEIESPPTTAPIDTVLRDPLTTTRSVLSPPGLAVLAPLPPAPPVPPVALPLKWLMAAPVVPDTPMGSELAPETDELEALPTDDEFPVGPELPVVPD